MAIFNVTSATPIQVVNRRVPPVPQVIFNRDPLVALLIGLETSDHQVPDFTSLQETNIIDAFASVTVDGTASVWALAQPPVSAPAGTTPMVTVTVEVYPTGISQATSPLAIGTAIGTSGIALAIAEAIAAQGVSLLGAPTLLYGGTVIQAGAAFVGATVANADYPAGGSRVGAANIFDGFVSRPMAVSSQKVFNGAGSFPSVVSSDLQGLLNAKCQLWMCYKPAFNPPTAADATSLSTSITAFKTAAASAGAPPPKVVLWHEPQDVANNMSATQFITMAQFYYPTVHATGLVMAYCSAGGQGEPATGTYYPGPTGCDEVGLDLYAASWVAGTTAATLQALADANSQPFGFSEFGIAANATEAGRTSQAQMLAFMAYIQTLMQTRLGAGKTNSDLMYYDGNSATGTPWNVINSATDYRVPDLQSMFDTLSKVPVPTFPVASGVTVTPAPISPSPGAGYAIAGGISYDITVNLVAGASSTVPFALVTLNWLNTDVAGAQPVASQSWVLPMGTNGTTGTVVTGVGPQHGQFLQVTVKNLDTVTCTVGVQVNSTSRPVNRHNWKWDAVSSVSVPTYTLPSTGGAQANSLGIINAVTIGAGASTSRLMGLFAGPAYARMKVDTSGMVAVTLIPEPFSLWANVALFNETPSTSEFIQPDLVLPRAPCLITFTNGSGVNQSVSAEVIAND